MKQVNKDKIVLAKILERIEVLEISTANIDQTSFLTDKMRQHAVAMAFLYMGELTNHLSQEFRESAKDIPFALMKGMRNVIAHEYDVLDFLKIWQTIQEDIPNLKSKIEEFLK